MMSEPDDGLTFAEIRIIYPAYPTGTKVLDTAYREHALRVKEFYTTKE